MKPAYLQSDTLDDRREIYHLLHRLPPPRRVGYLSWCCRQCYLPHSKIHPTVAQKTLDLADLAMRDDSADSKLTMDVWIDYWMLCAQYELNADKTLVKLMELVRKQR